MSEDNSTHPQLIRHTGRRTEDGPTWKYIGISTLGGMTFLLVAVFTFSFTTVMSLQNQVNVLNSQMSVFSLKIEALDVSCKELKDELKARNARVP